MHRDEHVNIFGRQYMFLVGTGALVSFAFIAYGDLVC